MLGEQAIIPNFTSYPNPSRNPNPSPHPLPSHTDASQYPNSQGFDGLQDQSAPLNWTTDSTTHDHVGVTMSETPNNVLVTTTQPENILPFQCEVCNISCNTKDVLEKHKIGKKHLKIVKRLADSSADASETLVGELENKKHRLIQNGATTETLIHCDICNVFCNNQEIFQKHVAGKKHSAKSIIQQAGTNAVFDATSDSSGGQQKKPDPFQCEICKITCTSNELLKAHIAGKKHLKKMKDSEQIPNMPLTPVASQDTPPTKPVIDPESSEGKTVNLQEAKQVCELCGITCNTNEMFKIHITGKKHLKKMKDSGQMPNLPLTPIASQDTPTANPESNEGKTVGLHETKPVCEICGISCDTDEMMKFHTAGKKHRKNLEKSEKLIGPNPALTTEPAATPMVIGPLQEGIKRKNKGGTDEDVEAKKQKIVQGGASSDAVQTCNLCNVVCNSPRVFISHLAGQKHAAMAVKQAETQAVQTGQES
ncbi:hypothetical protein L1987_08421 [Smallanthus sonchifolius]|uniref:Uncharacterized protein n=1 Tax=Smallanthus sonchifolius TaxID=185202 RepID=A0ACB9JMC0_9ASTR|nr:hypothetical protein L1987_08421 [Smallanthus sonchifolius]